MPKITIAQAIKCLITALKKDPGYRYSWQANIAMAYKDNEYWYRKASKRRYMTKADRHAIANKAADYFLTILCMTSKSKKPAPKRSKQ